MPNYRGHLFGGALTYVLIITIIANAYTFIPLKTNILIFCFVALLLGALFPDIDIVRSAGQKIFFSVLFVATIVTIFLKHWQMLIILLFIAVFPFFTRHRGIVHHPWFVIMIPLLVPAATKYCKPASFNDTLTITMFFIAGALSHLILDFGLVKVTQLLFLQRKT